MKILISAAEASSDTHGAAYLTALRTLVTARGESFSAFGIGGERLRAVPEFQSVVDARELLSMGFVEVLGRLPRIMSALSQLEAAAKREKPDFAVLIDYPDFHFRLASRLGKLGIPVISYIPPKVWVWRRSRVERMKELFKHVFCIFPFEKAFYRSAGLSVDFEGNPLLDELPLSLSREDARRSFGVSNEEKVLLLMPGSRPSELKYHLEPMIEAAALANAGGTVLMALPWTADRSSIERQAQSITASSRIKLLISQGNAWEAMRAADAGIIKSGTSTLEAAVMGLPQVVVYKTHPISEWIFKTLIRYRKPISLVNLVMDSVHSGHRAVEELILKRFSVAEMAKIAGELLHPESGAAATQRKNSAEIRQALQAPGGGSPSQRMAERTWALRSEWTANAPGLRTVHTERSP